jgi:hypothetical protein
MRNLLIAVAVIAAISLTPSSSRANFLGLFGFDCCGPHNCGCARGNCGGCCEPACGCDNCCEPACGCGGCCEPACGCGSGCFANGRQYAGQCFDGCCKSRVPICPCVGCKSGCGGCCEPACGCDNCCEPACGCGGCCEPCGCGTGCATWCGSGTANCPRKCCLKNCGFCSGFGTVLGCLCKGCPCGGCSGEVYWSEWHNDPPCCQDPCNNCGQWIGPSGCGCNSGACGCNGGCNGGCSSGACGCEGGYGTTQATPTKNGSAYVKHSPAYRTPVANSNRMQQPQQSTSQTRSSYASQKQNQQPQMRTASRPTTNRVQPNNGNSGTQARPILW